MTTRGSLTCQPRFGTPRSDRATLGDKAAVIAARLRRPLMPWQQHVADVALEVNPDGSLFYDEVNLVVGRQEGKTELKFVLMVMRMTVMASGLGPQRVTYTMQNRKKARTRLERDYAPRLRKAAGFKEIPAVSRQRPSKHTEWRLGMNSGVEAIQFGAESYIQIDTPSRTDGHGDSIDAGFIDEAFAHEDNTVELGMEPAMLTRESAQLWVLSASGDGRSKYLWAKVVRGRKLAEAGTTVAYFEWSAEYGVDDPSSPETWRKACPALGYKMAAGGGITEAKLQALYRKALEDGRKEAMDGFCRSYLCMWPEVPVLEDTDERWLIFPKYAWTACGEDRHTPVGRLTYALAVDTNAAGEEWCSIAASDGDHVEIVTPPGVGPGTEWVVPKCIERRDRFTDLWVRATGPVGKLIGPLERAGFTVHQVKANEYVQACGEFKDGVLIERIHWDPQASGSAQLTKAFSGGIPREVQDGAWVLSRSKSAVDVGPGEAAIVARWASLNGGGSSIYEERGVRTLG